MNKENSPKRKSQNIATNFKYYRKHFERVRKKKKAELEKKERSRTKEVTRKGTNQDKERSKNVSIFSSDFGMIINIQGRCDDEDGYL